MANNVQRVKMNYTTGKGELVGFITLTTPSKQFGTYSASILLSKEEGETLVAKLKELRKEQYKLVQNKGTLKDLPCIPYTTYNEATGENVEDAEGRYILKTANKAFNKEGKLVFKPQFINTKKEKITGDLKAAEGTIARLAILFEGYKAGANVGISAKLIGGQIINLVEYSGGASLSMDAFDVEEGYEGIGAEAVTTESKVEETVDEEELYF